MNWLFGFKVFRLKAKARIGGYGLSPKTRASIYHLLSYLRRIRSTAACTKLLDTFENSNTNVNPNPDLNVHAEDQYDVSILTPNIQYERR